MQDQDDRRMVLKAAADMLSELSAGQAPKQYSALYAEVFTHMQQLPVRPMPCLCPSMWIKTVILLRLRKRARSRRAQLVCTTCL